MADGGQCSPGPLRRLLYCGLQVTRSSYPNPIPCESLACKPVSVACEPSLWPRPSPCTGKRISDARDGRRQTAHGRSSFVAETARPVFQPRKRPQIAGYCSETGKRRFAVDCVVGPGGLEPPTRPL